MSKHVLTWEQKMDLAFNEIRNWKKKEKVTKKSFNADFKGIEDADALVIISGHAPRSFTGANVELGIALALKKPCYALGELRNSALYWGVIRTPDIYVLNSLLTKEAEE